MGSDRRFSEKMNRTITLTRRVTIGIIAVSACAVIVSATILASFLVPSSVVITSQPNLFVYDTNGNVVTQFQFGDVQQTQSTSVTVTLKNGGGSATMYLIDQSLTGSGSKTSLTTSGLPSGVTLTWNFASIGSADCSGSVAYPCIALFAGQSSPQLTLTLSATTGATPGTYSFTTEFDAFNSASG